MKKTHNYRVHYSSAIKSMEAQEDLGMPREIDIFEELERQIERERKSASEYPESYRLADIMNSAGGNNYRSGSDGSENYMTHEDFMRLIVAETKISEYGKNPGRSARSEIRPAAPYNVRQVVKAGAGAASYECVIDGDSYYGRRIEDSDTTLAGYAGKLVDKWFPNTSVVKPDRKVRRRIASSAAGIAWVMIFAVVLALPIALGVLKSEASGELLAKQEQLAALEAEEKRLSAEFESSIDLREVENIAVNEYGMIKLNQSTVRVLRINGTDSIESFSETKSNSLVPALLSALGIRSGNE